MTLRTALRGAVIVAGAALTAASLLAIALAFPWDIDDRGDKSSGSPQVQYYEKAYEAGAKGKELAGAAAPPLSASEEFYINAARGAAITFDVPAKVQAFVQRFDLANKKVLDVGAGSGLLQDVVADYTGLDISPTARRFFHKPFVQASATDVPFPSHSFDALWSVWVLEHIPNPERALE